MAMTRPETVIADDLVTVEPGHIAQTVLTVRNTGDQIAEYAVTLVPDCVAAGWTEADPPTFRLMPGKDQQVTLRFQPPLDPSTPAGSFPYGVMVTPDETHQAPAVAEADLAIGAFHALSAELKPARTRGRWRGRYVVKLENQGSDDIRIKLTAPDEGEGLSYALAPTTVAVPPRTTAEAFLKVRPQSPQVLGRPVDHAFDVTYRQRTDKRADKRADTSGTGGPAGETTGQIEGQVQGTFTQKPLLSRLVLAALALLVIGAVLLAVLRPWEGPDPRRPPEPLENVQMISHADDAIVVAWDNTPNIDEVQIRQVDCTTADDLLPTALEEVTTVETTGSGRQSITLGDLDGDEDRCLQVRAVASGEASIWAPSPPTRVSLGSTLAAPTDLDAVHVGACTVDVEWTPVVPEGGDVLYQVAVDGTDQGDPIAEANLQLADQSDGQDLEITVTSVVPGAGGSTSAPPAEDGEDGGGDRGEGGPGGDEAAAGGDADVDQAGSGGSGAGNGEELRSDPSEPVTVTVPEGCEDEPEVDADEAREERDEAAAGGAAGGQGAEGGEDGEGTGSGGAGGTGGGRDRPGGPPRLEGRYWLLFTQPADPAADRTIWRTQWQVFGGDVGLYTPGDDEPQPVFARVGVEVLLSEDLGQGPPGQPVVGPGDEILYVDLYDADDEEGAREDCAQMNRLWRSFEGMFLNYQPCRLVHPDGTVEDIPPAL